MKKSLFLLTLIVCLSGCAINQSVLNTVNVDVKESPQPKEINKTDDTANTIKIVAVGDVMLSRVVGQKMKKLGYDYPYLKTKELLQSADITFANLETAITPGKEVKTGEMMFRADPESLVAMNEAGFDIVSLANNHTPNYGQKGLLDSFNYLDKNNIKYVGAGKNNKEATELKITEANGIKVGWLAYNADDVVPQSYQATDNKAGTNFMNISRLKKDVLLAKKEVDLLFVSMHAGTEYTDVPNSMQIDFAHAAIDAGADLIIGHHPHVVQHLEKYKNKFIIYSLGNFIFDQMWSTPTRQGVVAEISATKNNVSKIKFIPIVIDNYSQPRMVSDKEAKEIIKSLNYELSNENAIRIAN